MDLDNKVKILLKEYDTLRAEILQRINHRFGFLGLIIAGGGYALFSAKDLENYQLVVLIISAPVLFGIWFQLGNVIGRCAKRIAEIEKDINSAVGEDLLKWELEKRGSKIFHNAH